jgi:hypothetical protein
MTYGPPPGWQPEPQQPPPPGWQPQQQYPYQQQPQPGWQPQPPPKPKDPVKATGLMAIIVGALIVVRVFLMPMPLPAFIPACLGGVLLIVGGVLLVNRNRVGVGMSAAAAPVAAVGLLYSAVLYFIDALPNDADKFVSAGIDVALVAAAMTTFGLALRKSVKHAFGRPPQPPYGYPQQRPPGW